ncbi:unnamed protein product [Lota lota]
MPCCSCGSSGEPPHALLFLWFLWGTSPCLVVPVVPLGNLPMPFLLAAPLYNLQTPGELSQLVEVPLHRDLQALEQTSPYRRVVHCLRSGSPGRCSTVDDLDTRPRAEWNIANSVSVCKLIREMEMLLCYI